MSDSDANDNDSTTNQRNGFLRDAVVFQGKLLFDGLRDLVLMPVALIATVADVISREEPHGRRFYDVVHFGKQTENWINLFGAAERAPETDTPRPTMDGPSLDDFVDEFEQKLRSEHEKGDLSASAKEAFERIAEAARNAAAHSRGRRHSED